MSQLQIHEGVSPVASGVSRYLEATVYPDDRAISGGYILAWEFNRSGARAAGVFNVAPFEAYASASQARDAAVALAQEQQVEHLFLQVLTRH